MTAARDPFGPRALRWIVGLCAASFLAGLALVIFADDLDTGADVSSAEADSFSRSAIGHRAFVELLRALDVPVVVSRFDSASRASGGALLVLEPGRADDPDRDLSHLRALVLSDSDVLLALPKWNGVPDEAKMERWIRRADLVPAASVDALLDTLGSDARVVRSPAEAATCDADRYGATVELPHPQLLDDPSGELEPLVTCAGGLLAGLVRFEDGSRLVVLSDPDLLSTHGLARADNAAAAVALVDELRDGGPVVLDETAHGFIRRPSFWRQLFDLPLALATLQAGLLLALALWAGLRRFGPPVAPPPAIAPGKGFLIANTADLLEVGGHSPASLERYWHATQREVARALHAPADLDLDDPNAGLAAWLAAFDEGRHAARHGAARAAVAAATDPRSPAARRHVLRAARLVHAFKEDLLDGYRDRLDP